MFYRQLGRTDLQVSAICLGTMTWGEQNTEADAHAQLDAARAAGVNFIDTAEIYPVPPRAETQGLTERFLGTWLKKRKDRDQLIIATKVAARADWLPWIREGKARLDRANIEAALNASLARLQTDHIDLYQLHWPDRSTNFFGKLGYTPVEEEDSGVDIEETQGVLDDLIQTGKVLHFGVCNETPWGLMRYVGFSEARGLARPVTIQNPYNLLNRTFEIGLAEISHREQVGLLAYSPLAFGMLTGKYSGGAQPENARLSLFNRFTRYTNPQGIAAMEGYVALARKYGLEPAQMALAYVNSRPFVTSTIIGATSLAQLESNLASIDVVLPDELLEEIEALHMQHPNPCP